MVKLYIDGREIEAVEGQSVLNAALAADIYIQIGRASCRERVLDHV